MDGFSKVFVLVAMGLLLAACGGSGGGSNGTSSDSGVNTVLDVSPGGVWVTQNAADESLTKLYISETGEFILQDVPSQNANPAIVFLGSDLDGFRNGVGQVSQSSAGRITASYDQLQIELVPTDASNLPIVNPLTPDIDALIELIDRDPNIGAAIDFPATVYDLDLLPQNIESRAASCTLAGTLIEQVSLNVSLSCLDSSGITSVQMLNLVPEEDCSSDCVANEYYGLPSSLSRIAGEYSILGSSAGLSASLSISDEGSVSGVYSLGSSFNFDAGVVTISECQVDGSVSIIDEDYNLYDAEWSFSNCTDNAVYQDGTSFEGLLVLQRTGLSLDSLKVMMSRKDAVSLQPLTLVFFRTL